jgi:MoaA/NifB/PqqE/SkfB family radical SAM enzyme
MLHMLTIRLFQKKPFPLFVNLVVNRRCNLRCVYCFGEYYNRKEVEYSLEEIRGIIDELHSMGTRYILIQGGEPLLQRDLGQIIDHADRKGIITAIVSNGTLTSRFKEIPSLRKLDNICFSLDGFREGNDRQRGEGVFDRVVASIQEVRRLFPELRVRINAVLTRDTIDSFSKFLDFCERQNVDLQVGYLFKNHPLAAPVEKIKETTALIHQRKSQGRRIVASAETLRYVRDWPFENETWVTQEKAQGVLGHKAKKCQYGNYEIILDSNGNIYPCNALQGDPSFKPKNLKEVGIKEAFRHLQTKRCYTCNIASMLDTSEIINWNVGTILDRVKMELKGERLRRGGA